MAGGDIFGISTSGLLTAQRQLTTTGHNIANVNTAGYTRQRAEQEARLPQFSGSGFIGTGVDVQTTVRIASESLERILRDSNSELGRFEAYVDLASQVDHILANPESGLTPTLEDFFSALQNANDNPSSTPHRQVLLSEANNMTDRFNQLNDRFEQINDQVNQQLIDLSSEVSAKASSIAELNQQIINAIGIGQGDTPNDLMDQREQLIKEVAEKLDLSVVYQDDGAANIFIGSGQVLVVGNRASVLETQPNQFNPRDLDLMLRFEAGTVNIDDQLKGGEIQGIKEFKDEILEPVRRSIGRVAVALSEELNAQHRLGMTIQGTGAPFPLGGDLLTDLSGPITGLPGQTSATTASLTITDSRVLSDSDFLLENVAGNFRLTRLDDNVTYNGATIAALNTAMSATEGFTVASNVAAGESFLLRPTFDASANISVQVTNVLDVALAAPIVSRHGNDTDLAVPGTTGGAINAGNADITLPTIGNLTNIPLAGSITLTYNAGIPGFDVVGGPGGNIAYDPAVDFGGRTYSFAGFGNITFTISGTPQAGDIFVIENNTEPYDDNRNGLLMSALQNTKTIENSSSDFQAAYGFSVSDIGIKTHSAEIDMQAQEALNRTAVSERESYSGVNLDEEAANLLKYQQAYQASARVVSIADQMFQTLINSVG